LYQQNRNKNTKTFLDMTHDFKAVHRLRL
jgi:hypothetical protein